VQLSTHLSTPEGLKVELIIGAQAGKVRRSVSETDVSSSYTTVLYKIYTTNRSRSITHFAQSYDTVESYRPNRNSVLQSYFSHVSIRC